MKKIVVLVLVLMAFATGCGQSKNESLEGLFPEVEIKIPKEINVGNPVTIQAIVTAGGKPVDDAEEVALEIGMVNGTDGTQEKTTVTSSGNGVYELEKTFEKSGTYYVIAHTTALGMHTMPKKEFQVTE